MFERFEFHGTSGDLEEQRVLLGELFAFQQTAVDTCKEPSGELKIQSLERSRGVGEAASRRGTPRFLPPCGVAKVERCTITLGVAEPVDETCGIGIISNRDDLILSAFLEGILQSLVQLMRRLDVGGVSISCHGENRRFDRRLFERVRPSVSRDPLSQLPLVPRASPTLRDEIESVPLQSESSFGACAANTRGARLAGNSS